MKIYLRILGFIRPYLGIVLLSLVASLFYVVFNTASMWFTASLINVIFEDRPVAEEVQQPTAETPVTNLNERLKHESKQLIYQDNPVDTLKALCFIILGIFILKNIFYYLQGLGIGYVNMKVIQDARDRLYEKLNQLSMGFYDRHRTGTLSSIVINDVNAMNNSISNSFSKLLVEPANIVFFTTALFIISWRLTLMAIVVIPISAVLITKIGQSLRRKSSRTYRQIAHVMSILQEMLYNVRIVKAFATEDYENRRFQKSTQKHFHYSFRHKRLSVLSSPLNEIIGVAIGVILLWYGGLQVLLHNTLTSEDFIRFIILLFMLLQPLKAMSGLNNMIQTGVAAAERIFGILDKAPEVQERENAIPITEFKDAIEYRNVYFKYEDNWVLEDINLRISRGEVVALVGPSGAGKSTLVDLVPRFYDIDKGSVTIDGLDVRDLSFHSLRNLLGMVTQETILFNDTIAQNIAYGIDAADEDAIREAARLANAYEFIEKLPRGFETNIGDRGLKLSGGQRQRISIARALLNNPPILILDEATSSLDTESEQLVQNAIDNVMQDRTTLVIAHRLSTITHADKIVVLEDGHIVEEGDHHTLLAANGAYRRLYDMQFGAHPAPIEESS
ncbi:MAG TPA: ABC transporter ATP-binding protein [bacterium]|nr:ABC transporter ATP-binding protein [bacterium]